MTRNKGGARARTVASLLLGGAVGLGFGVQSAIAEAPQAGGTLNFVVAGEAPSKDGHREQTYALIHPYAPFYSLLIRVNPEDPQSSDFVCDLCVGDVPEPTNGGKTYTFKVKEGVSFHDGTPMTSADVKASYDRIIFPPEGVPSSRKTFFNMVESVEAPDDTTIVFNLKFPSGAFLPALATPVQLDLQQEGSGSAWLRLAQGQRERHRSVQVRRASTRGVRRRGEERELPPRGATLPRRLPGHHRQGHGGTHPGHSRQPGGDRVPELPAAVARRPRECARRQDHGAGKRLELRTPVHPEPRTQAV